MTEFFIHHYRVHSKKEEPDHPVVLYYTYHQTNDIVNCDIVLLQDFFDPTSKSEPPPPPTTSYTNTTVPQLETVEPTFFLESLAGILIAL